MKYKYLIIKYQDIVHGIMGLYDDVFAATSAAKIFSEAEQSIIFVVIKTPMNKPLGGDYRIETVAEFSHGMQR